MAKPPSPAASLLIISGLEREARIFTGPGVISICGDAPRLRTKLAQMADLPLRMVVSFGICGGLDPALRRGSLVVGAEIVSGGERIKADETAARRLERRLADAGERVVLGRMAGTDAPVLTVQSKTRLRTATGAIAVDMESLVAGRFARERGVPFAILRAVSDPADRDLPSLVLKAVGSDGRTNIAAVVAGLIGSPNQLPGLIAAARDSGAAFRALGRCRSLPGLFLGLGLADF
ncbi:hopanoid-associated phosphorylase [Rhizobiales bacterium GAS191]|jgi:adenosylhomocysteine nucleosidase|nr:hopanoid-associated phosphorylase [Rhizobiales bacterium GAS113]SEC06797.1 hopanoid-associated phosphorylase [Rhizobiales bacterium GAS188]SED15625.1 hopanoid-associated phosphorylase [Rhizobiales bacterium GAS191]